MIACSGLAYADWTVVDLNPPGSAGSFIWGGGATEQVGGATINGSSGAAVWYGTSASAKSLHPAGAVYSRGWAGGDGQQVGWVEQVQNARRASLWTGTADSYVDLHPNSAINSQAHGARGGQQVGYATYNSYFEAVLWRGSAASMVSLHPTGARDSVAKATDGHQQVGDVSFDSVTDRAALWTGTASSFVNLHPSSAGESSLNCVSNGMQGGWARYQGQYVASIWSGTAASWVNLRPAGHAGMSIVYGVGDGFQAGFASPTFGGGERAAFWAGSAASYVDLHAYLSPTFWSSAARSVWIQNGHVYVAGYASGPSGSRATMWILTPEPGTFIAAGAGISMLLLQRRKRKQT